MSTTALIRVHLNRNSQTPTKVCLMKHHDGYPEGVADLINDALMHTYELNGLNNEIPLMNALICANPRGLRITEDHKDPSRYFGAEFVYDIDLNDQSITVEEFNRDGNSKTYTESIVDFLNINFDRMNRSWLSENDAPFKPAKAIEVEMSYFSKKYLVNEDLAIGLKGYFDSEVERYRDIKDFEKNSNYINYQKTLDVLKTVTQEYAVIGKEYAVFNDSNKEGFELMDKARLMEYARNIIEANRGEIDPSRYPLEGLTDNSDAVNAFEVIFNVMSEEVMVTEHALKEGHLVLDSDREIKFPDFDSENSLDR